MTQKEIYSKCHGKHLKKLALYLFVFVFRLFFPTFILAQESIADLVKKVSPAVVAIHTYDNDGKAIGQGTGFIVSDTGEVVTNYHVLLEAFSGEVKMVSGKIFPIRGIIAEDHESDLIKIILDAKETTFPTVNLAERSVRAGQRVVVVGSPLGLEGTVSDGLVSAVREVPGFGTIFQMTAPISPGSSGSPVFDLKGNLVGVATLVIKEAENIGFAIPSSKVRVLQELEQWREWVNQIRKEKELGLQQWTSRLKSDYRISAGWALKEFSFSEWVDMGMWTSLQTAEGLCNRGIYEWGLHYPTMDQIKVAIGYFKQSVEKDPEYAEAYYYLGFCYLYLDQYQESTGPLEQAIRIQPEFAEARRNLGWTYAELGRYHNAIEQFKQAIHMTYIKHDLATAHRGLGCSYYNLGQYEKAVEEYKKALRDPLFDGGWAHLGLGDCYLKLGRYHRAVEEYEMSELLITWSKGTKIEALLQFENRDESYYNFGLAYYNLGRYRKAVTWLKRTISLSPKYTLAHYYLGASYLMLGDREGALEEHEILKALDSNLAKKLFDLINE